MTTTQLSFAAFAAVQRQPAVKARPVRNIPRPCADYGEFARFTGLSKSVVASHGLNWRDDVRSFPVGALFLMSRANVAAPSFPGSSTWRSMARCLRYYADRCIQAGC